MGNNQSRPSVAAVNEKLMERLQALHIKDERPMNEKDGFVVVGGEARTLYGVENGIPSLTVEAPRYTPGVKYQQDVSAASVSEWEKELMQDPKVLHTALVLSPTYRLLEPPRPRSSQLQLCQRRALIPIRCHRRHPEVQHQDSLRGLARHKTSLIRKMLALRIDQRLSRRYYEEVQAIRVPAVAGIPLLLGQD